MHKWLILLSLLATAAGGQSAYTWVDENGQRHFSDRPYPGADTIELRSAQGFATTPPSAAPPVAEQQDPAEPYLTFNIVRPTHQETLWNIGGALDVAVEVNPILRPGHRIGIYLDGVLTGGLTTGTQLRLTDVFRGQHTLQAAIVDAQGEEVLRSVAITIMVQQTSLLNPNNPNAR